MLSNIAIEIEMWRGGKFSLIWSFGRLVVKSTKYIIHLLSGGKIDFVFFPFPNETENLKKKISSKKFFLPSSHSDDEKNQREIYYK